MANKEVLLRKLTSKPIPRNFTMRELDQLMSKCGCDKTSGGRGSSIQYTYSLTGETVTFDQPHPQKELRPYQLKKVIGFLQRIGELKEGF
ncbi:MAG: type II toxin-antitoxin system HicA family toxin [Clostridia bacterium]|nr:type II toxin-antitoxin system HicA family toxin [Clostridia bacterium]MBQ1549115.1 type II toxin-antitoxin system HicA family toxin [Clostridia bacterium]MBQ3995538.1 type II toxin-antitoxin system HicA family toxin [Clostridia bacterium]